MAEQLFPSLLEIFAGPVVLEEKVQAGRHVQVNACTGQLLRPAQGGDQHSLGGEHGLVQVDLPVHQPPGHEEFFDRINPFFLHHQLALVHGQHLDDAVVADHAFVDAGEVAVAVEVVHPVHVELAGDELMEEFFGVLVFKNIDCQREGAAEFFVELFHKEPGEFFMGNVDEGMLQGMRKRPVPDVVQQYGDAGSRSLFIRNSHPF
jgi:hypothetical protein